MAVHFVNAEKKVILWNDLVDVMGGQPYRICRMIDIPSSVVYRAKKRGYFTEGISFRIYLATCTRVKLTRFDSIHPA